MREEEKEIIADLPKWKGYDIDELRYRRAYMLARCEIDHHFQGNMRIIL